MMEAVSEKKGSGVDPRKFHRRNRQGSGWRAWLVRLVIGAAMVAALLAYFEDPYMLRRVGTSQATIVALAGVEDRRFEGGEEAKLYSVELADGEMGTIALLDAPEAGTQLPVDVFRGRLTGRLVLHVAMRP